VVVIRALVDDDDRRVHFVVARGVFTALARHASAAEAEPVLVPKALPKADRDTLERVLDDALAASLDASLDESLRTVAIALVAVAPDPPESHDGSRDARDDEAPVVDTLARLLDARESTVPLHRGEYQRSATRAVGVKQSTLARRLGLSWPVMDAIEPTERPLLLISRARSGDRDALGELLGLYRNYLRILAAAQVGESLRGRVEPSDIVQETFLEAATGFASFRGTSEAELCAWLRRILVHNIADEAKHHRRQGRDVDRQVSLDQALARSSFCLHEALATNFSSPSSQAMRRERAVIVADVLAELSEDHRTVIVLRNLLQLRFEEVAERMGRSSVAVRLLWLRAIEKLRGLLGEEP